MPVHNEITVCNVEDEFRVCPACGYDYGFHTSFLRVNTGKDSPVKSTREVVPGNPHMPGMRGTV